MSNVSKTQHFAKRLSLKYFVLLFIFFVTFLSLIILISTGKKKSLVQNNDGLTELMKAVESGNVAYMLTEPNEIKAYLGEPEKEEEKENDKAIMLCMSYPDTVIWFRGDRESRDRSLKLRYLSIMGKEADIGGPQQGKRQIVVNSIDDFHKMEIENLNLKNLDLSDEGDYLRSVDFDSLTQWPSPERLPPGFDPQKLLEDGKNPGLGIRALHEQGINGEGVVIAILDQPLLLGHEEYTSRLIFYDNTRASWLPPQMHGSRAAGIAAGQTCGVAPGAYVFYYAGRTSAVHEDQAYWINEIINYNKSVESSNRIRVISISESPEDAENNEAFLEACQRARDTKILIVTVTNKNGLTLIEGKDPDKPESYTGGGSDDELLVPTRNKTLASHRGVNTYIYSRGLAESWTAPYIAGLAALALQVNPELEPEVIEKQLLRTATHTEAGLIVNPRKFIESIKPKTVD